MRLPRSGSAVAIAIAIGVGVGAPAPAHGSAVVVEAIASAATEGQYVAFTAGQGERNRVSVRYSGTATVSVRVPDTAGSYDAPLGRPRRGGVRADLDGRADDGSAGERDRIRTDVENLDGTDFGDVLTGNGRANEIDGVGGADRISGLGGNDLITAASAANVSPGAGADRVVGGRIVRARDASRDRVSSCGLAIAERRDVVTGCRSVRRG